MVPNLEEGAIAGAVCENLEYSWFNGSGLHLEIYKSKSDWLSRLACFKKGQDSHTYFAYEER